MAPYPASAVPFGFVPPPAPRKSPWTIVFGVAAAVFLLASGGAGALYFLEHNEATKTTADLNSQIDDLQDQLEQAQDDLSVMERDLNDIKADSEACSEALTAVFDFVPSDPENPTEAELDEYRELNLAVLRSCNVA